MAYVIDETEDGTFRCENDETGATGYGESPEESLEALLGGEEGDVVEEIDETIVYEEGYSDGFRAGFEAAKRALNSLESEDYEDEG